MEKVIEQVGDIPEMSVTFRSDLKYKCFQLTQDWKIKKHTIHVPESKAREVAISICPELGEPTIKTDNTKVILHLESELKEAAELIEKGKFLYESLAEAGQISITDPKKITESINAFNAFLTKHKSKE